MHETMNKSKELCEIERTITQALQTEISKGIQNTDTHELGEVVDMIKDLAEAREKCWKACYYKKIIEAMDDNRDDEEAYEYGRRGYRKPPIRRPRPRDYDEDFDEMLRESDRYVENPRYGQAYNEYQTAKRHYTATNSARDWDDMNRHASEHVSDTIETLREIYKGADPELKKRIKADMNKLISEMPG